MVVVISKNVYHLMVISYINVYVCMYLTISIECNYYVLETGQLPESTTEEIEMLEPMSSREGPVNFPPSTVRQFDNFFI